MRLGDVLGQTMASGRVGVKSSKFDGGRGGRRAGRRGATARAILALLTLCLFASGPLVRVGWCAGVFVDENAAGGGTGSDWANAYTTVAAALADPAAPTQPIRIAAGTYNETSLTLASGMQLYGGYDAATGARDPLAYVTTVNAGGLGRVFTATDATNVVLDGLEITGGLAARCGGVRLTGGTATIVNCNIHNNSALTGSPAACGGGVCVERAVSVAIVDSTVADNVAGVGAGDNVGRGGGIGFDNKTLGGVAGATLAVTNCTITGNSAARGSYSGGGICALGSSAMADSIVIADSTFAGNVAGGDLPDLGRVSNGGAIALENIENATVENCTIDGNTANTGGAGIAAQWSNLSVTGCVLSGNSITGAWTGASAAYRSYGGGAILYGGVDASHNGGSIAAPVLTVDKSRIAHNVVNGGGSGAIRITGGTVAGGSIAASISNCVIESNTLNLFPGQTLGDPGIEAKKTGLLVVNLDVTNCTLKDNMDVSAPLGGNPAAIVNEAVAGSVAVRNCIVAGTFSANNAPALAIDPGPLGGSSTILNNLFWNNQANGAEGTNAVLADPDFVGSGPDPLSLDLASPAIDAGTADGVSLTDDILGNPRPVDGPDPDADAEYDIGAYEFAPSASPPPPGKAYDPNPADGETNVSFLPTLTWNGSSASSYDVYFGAETMYMAYAGNRFETSYSPGVLNYGTSYLWRIDSKNAGGTTTGDVWDFETEPIPPTPTPAPAPNKAVDPNPADGATSQSVWSTLQWENGGGAQSYDVYFGAETMYMAYVGNFSESAYNAYCPGLLQYGARYDWRIDPRNSVGMTTTGDVWGFETEEAPPPAGPGGIVAWGRNTLGQCVVPSPNEDFTAMAAGRDHNLGLKADGSIVVWGGNSYGQRNVPLPNAGFTAVAAGRYHSLALRSDGSVAAWGDNGYGQCYVSWPNADFVAVAGGTYHSLGLKRDGSIAAWGNNNYGQSNPPSPNAGFVAVAAGWDHSVCLKTDGSIVAWGRNDYGQCNVPSPNTGFVAVAAGYRVTLGLKADGSIVAWGYAGMGQCDIPAPNTGFVAVSAGYYHCLGLKADGSVVAWAYNSEGQCTVPSPNTGFGAISAGLYHSLGLKAGEGAQGRPGMPMSPSPAHGAGGVSVSTNLDWSDCSDAESYDVYLWPASEPKPATTLSQNLSSSFCDPPSDLADDVAYCWQVVAKNASGETLGAIWWFTTADPPLKAVNPSPEDGATSVPCQTSLSWSNGGGAQWYEVYLGAETMYMPRIAIRTETDYSPVPVSLNYSTNYCWRVDSHNAAGMTPGDVWGFGTELPPPPPNKTLNPNPADGATSVPVTGTLLLWENGGGATGYYVYLGTDPGNLACMGWYSDWSFNPGSLQYGTTYYWRVDAQNDGGATPGDTWTFATETREGLTLYVPSQYPTIQAAIDAAISGDAVVVAPGWYGEHLYFGGKNIVLRSTNPLDAATVSATVIDGTYSGPVVIFAGSETPSCVLEGFTIANGWEGGVLCNGSRPTIRHNVIANNTTSSYGGGIYYCRGTIQNNTITANTAGTAGAGLELCQGALIENNCVTHNRAQYGAAMNNCCDGVIRNNIFAFNVADYDGGAIRDSRSALINNTICHNTAWGFGGGLGVAMTGEIRNCIVWGNFAPGEAQVWVGVAPTYSCIQDWTGGGEGNIASDPLLANAAGGDFHLLPGSPCIDAGETVALATDFEGDARPIGAAYDIGADEFSGEIPTPTPEPTATPTPSPAISYVRVGGTGSGSSWADAFGSIQQGIDAAAWPPLGQVWVAEGTYSESIAMQSGVAAYGGFAGTESDLSQRDPAAHTTVIDASVTSGSLPAEHVVTMSIVVNTRLDGFTVTGGHATASLNGGGVYCEWADSSNVITQCTITGNRAGSNFTTGSGGGIYCAYSSPRIEECAIDGNIAGYRGGAIYLLGPVSTTTTLTNCTLSGNRAGGMGTAYGNGGAIYCSNTPLSLSDCTISGNSAGVNGGGVYLSGTLAGGSVVITGCTFSANNAGGPGPTGMGTGMGGAVYCTNASPTISDCTVVGNTAGGDGGGLCFRGAGTAARMENCAIAGNTARRTGGGVQSYGPITMTNCVVSGNVVTSNGALPSEGGGGLYLRNGTIINTLVTGNSALQSAGGGVACVTGGATPPPAKIVNCTIADNVGARGSSLYLDSTSATLRNDVFEDTAGGTPYLGPHGTSTTLATNPSSNLFLATGEARFAPGLAGAWTEEPFTTFDPETSLTLTVLTDANATFSPSALENRVVNVNTTTPSLQALIVTNTTSTQVTFLGDLTGVVAAGDSYRVLDYHLRAGSPCIDAGIDASAPEYGSVVDDMDGEPRPVGAAYDVGADEFTSRSLLTGSIVAWGSNNDGEGNYAGQCDVPAPNERFVAVSAGPYHSLGLKADGSIRAWGLNANGQCNVPEPNAGFVSVSAGYYHGLGLKADGSVVAWGDNGSGQCGVPSPNTDFVAIEAGGWHSLGLKADGTLVAWGACVTPTPDTGFKAMAAGGWHSLGLRTDGSVVAWGLNNVGQCDVPAPNAGFVAVAAGSGHSLGLKSDGSIVAWGDNSYGSGQCNVPAPNTGFVALAAGEYHSLGLKSDGSITAWGDNSRGECSVPAPNTGFFAVSGGGYHSLALKPDGGMALPGRPTLVNPHDGATDLDPQLSGVDLVWNVCSNAASYDLYLWAAVDQKPATPTMPDLPPEMFYFCPQALLTFDTTYRWQVVAKNPWGETASLIWSFTTGPEFTPTPTETPTPEPTPTPVPPPGKATDPNPADGATSVPVQTTLTWSATDATSFDAWFGTSPESLNYMGNYSSATYSPGTLSWSTAYFWRIDSFGFYGMTPGDVWSFTTAAPLATQIENHKVLASDGKRDDRFGYALAMSGDRMVTGAPYVDRFTTGGVTWGNVGAVYVHQWDGTQWAEGAKLEAADGAASDQFGFAVSMSGDRLAAGAPYADPAGVSNVGAVYVYGWNGTQWAQETKIAPPDGVASDQFGRALAMSSDRLVVGVPYADLTQSSSTLTDVGAAYIYRWDGAQWAQEAKLSAAGGAASDQFGYAVSLSGDRLAIGAPYADTAGADAGAVYVYRWDGVQWTLEAKTTASNAMASDRFGYAVSMAGNKLLVGAPYADAGGYYDAGTGYVLCWDGVQWVEEAQLTAPIGLSGSDMAGRSVVLDGDVAVLGATGADGLLTNSGAAYEFRWDGAQWVAQSRMVALDTASSDYFGYAVAASGGRTAVGAYSAESRVDNVGAVYVYDPSPSVPAPPTPTPRPTPPSNPALGTWIENRKILASDGLASDRFGWALSLSGDRLAVGAPYADQTTTPTLGNVGAVYVNGWDGAQWVEQTCLRAANGASSDQFGYAVALSGDMLAVGAPYADRATSGTATRSDAGAVYVYRWDGAQWAQEAELVAFDGLASDRFGFALSLDGNRLAVGTPNADYVTSGTGTWADLGAVYVYVWDGAQWALESKLTDTSIPANDRFGYAVALSGERLAVGLPYSNTLSPATGAVLDTGSARVYRWNGSQWTHEATLAAPDAMRSDRFGFALAMSSDTLAVGAPYADVPPWSDAGMGYVFRWTGAQWIEEARLTASVGMYTDQFGRSVAVGNDVIVFGASGANGLTNTDTGAAYVYRRSGTQWTEESLLVASDGQPGDQMGYAAGISGSRVAVGAYSADSAIANVGAAYLYDLDQLSSPPATPTPTPPETPTPEPTATPTGTPTATPTPWPWNEWVQNPQNGHWYRLTAPGTWHAAKAEAEALGGYLACAGSAEENIWIHDMLQVPLGPQPVWIGLTDEAVEGVWVWVNGEPFTYANWGNGEPNSMGDEDYLEMMTGGDWNDLDAAHSLHGVIERETEPGAPTPMPTPAPSGPIRFVDQDAVGGTQTGDSWANAFTSIDAALATANGNPGAERIWIKAGTYLLTSDTALTVADSVWIFGGLDGDEATQADVDAQTSATRTTVGHSYLSYTPGMGRTIDPGTAGVFFIDVGHYVLFDQIDVTSGVARSTPDYVFGYPNAITIGAVAGGIHAETSVTLALCDCDITGIVTVGTAQTGGGGAITMRRGARLTMTGCAVSDNISVGTTGRGGTGVLVEGLADVRGCVFERNRHASHMDPLGLKYVNVSLAVLPPCEGEVVIKDSVFADNYGTARGAALKLSWDTTNTLYSISNCAFVRNSGRDGGAINLGTSYNGATWSGARGPGRMVMTDCVFDGNLACGSDGACIKKFGNQAGGAPSVIRNCSFVNNIAARNGGAISWKDFDVLQIEACVFSGNRAENAGAALMTEAGTLPGDGSGGLIVTNCLFSRNSTSVTTSSGVGGVIDNGGNTSSMAPGGPRTQVVNCTFIDNTTATGGVIRQGGAFGQVTMPTLEVVNCLMAGNSTTSATIYASTGSGRVANTLDRNPSSALAGIGGPAAGDFYTSNFDTTGEPGVSLETGKIVSDSSAAIDLGLDSDPDVTIPATDMEGTGRYDYPGRGVGGVTDAGAFEYPFGEPVQTPTPTPEPTATPTPGPVFYVDAEAAGLGDGSSWSNAFNTIQEGVDAAYAAGGGEVWVAEGTYTSITNPVVTMKAGVHLFGGFVGLGSGGNETARSQRNWTNHVTAIDGENARRCVNGASNATLDGFTVARGHASDGNGTPDETPIDDGGGMYNDGVSPTVANCIFDHNWADHYGAGMYNCSASSPTVTACSFLYGSAYHEAGICSLAGGALTVVDCIFSFNEARYWGGGAMGVSESCAGVITNCTFSHNRGGNGGAVVVTYNNTTTVFTNCAFWNNSASSTGGAISSWSANPTFINCTFSGNSAPSGGSIYSTWSSVLTFKNCILWGGAPDEIAGNSVDITYSDIQGGYTGTGNINADPLFVDTVNGDLHLQAGSPCIDSATSVGAPAADIDGLSRPQGAGVDMGAYEERFLCYVDADNTSGTENGLTWATAFNTIQEGVDTAYAAGGGEVWVAEGTYTSITNPVVTMKAGVHMFGGFIGLGSGGNETARSQRNWTNHVTAIDGENTRRCVFGANNATLDGFTVTRGWAQDQGGPWTGAGAGMRNEGVSPTVANCTFASNRVSPGDIGAMMNYNSASPLVTNCVFVDNYGEGGTGGMGNVISSSPKVMNCVFQSNSAGGGFGAGALSASRSSLPEIDDCIFIDNSGCMYGGAFYADYDANAVLTNCLFCGNSAIAAGGAVSAWDASPTFINCTFWNNAAPSGGTIHSTWSSALTFKNCIVWGGNPDEIAGNPVDVTYSDIQGGYTGTGNINADPLFVDAANGDLHLQAESPCIDTATSVGAPATDIDGVSRPQGAGVDMGAYEFDQTSVPTPTPTPGPAALLAWYKFGETSGTLAVDSSGNANHAALEGGAGWSPAVATGWPAYDFGPSCASFNHTAVPDGRVCAPHSDSLNVGLGSVSMSFLVKIDPPADMNMAYQTIFIQKGSYNMGDGAPSDPNHQGKRYEMYYKSNRLNLVVDDGDALNHKMQYQSGDDPGLVTGNWVHVVGTVDMVSQQAHLYVNGQELAGTFARAEWPVESIDEPTGLFIANTYPGVGSDIYPATFTGLMDDVRIYRGVLTQAEILDMYGPPPATPTPEPTPTPMPLPDKATDPNPADGATSVPIRTTLSWNCSSAASFDVYLGTAPESLGLVGNRTVASYSPAALNFGQSYFWRIDSLNVQGGATMGDVWSFQTRPAMSRAYVDMDATGAGTGASWADAFASIQQGVDASNEVWVADGTYPESIVMHSNAQVYGGFAGNETDLSQRDSAVHVATIDASTADAGGPADHAVLINSVTSATLDGFAVKGGCADGAWPNDRGGGVLAYSSSARIASCTVTSNSALSGGGGIASAASSSLVVTDCAISNNYTWGSAGAQGGAIFSDSGSGGSIVSNSTIWANTSVGRGGGISLMAVGKTNRVDGCRIADNQAGVNGGGVYCNSTSATLTNCIIDGNEAVEGGGAVFGNAPCIRMVNCTLSHNSAGNGAAISMLGHLYPDTSLAVVNTVFAHNSGEAVFENGMVTSALIRNCLFFANQDVCYHRRLYNQPEMFLSTPSDINAQLPGSSGNIEGDPLLTPDCHLTSGSPCVDAGINASEPRYGHVVTDMDGEPRPMGAAFDVGADELTGPLYPPEKASNPNPTDGATGVAAAPTLSWNSSTATSYDVYFGVEAGSLSHVASQSETSYSPGTLNYDTAYFWRIDSSNAGGATPGDPWSFSTETEPTPVPTSTPVPTPTPGPTPMPMGAVRFVDQAAAGAQTGSDWANAYTTIRAGLANPDGLSHRIQVAAGTYNETSLTLTSGMEVYGGYNAATGNRDLPANTTMVNAGGMGRVFTATDATQVVLDGLEITGGLALRTGGVRLTGGTAVIANCNIHGNSAFTGSGSDFACGGGVCVERPALVTIANSTVAGNVSGVGSPTDDIGRGGGIGFDNKIVGAVSDSTLIVTNCTITGNSAARGSYNGGGLVALGNSALGDTVVISGCTFSGNMAGRLAPTPGHASGGAIGLENIENATVENCTIEGNTATIGGAGIAAQWCNLAVTECVLSGNVVAGGQGTTAGAGWKSNGGGALIFSAIDASHNGGALLHPVLSVDKCRIANNVVNHAGGGTIRVLGTQFGGAIAVTARVSNCLFEANTLNLDAGQSPANIGIEAMKADAVPIDLDVANCTFKDNADLSGAFAGVPAIPAAIANECAAGNLAVRNCIIVGTASANNGPAQAIDTGIYGIPSTLLNNLFWGNQANGPEGANAVLADPVFVGSGPEPLSLDPASPAIDAGTADGVALTDDILGYARPVDGPDPDVLAQYDIGAYEYGSSAPGAELLAWYKFDEPLGTLAVDSSGNGNHAALEPLRTSSHDTRNTIFRLPG